MRKPFPLVESAHCPRLSSFRHSAAAPISGCLVAVLTLVSTGLDTLPGLADDVSSNGAMLTRLNTPMTTIQDGKPLREAIAAIADQVELNWWLDRSIDPTMPIAPGPVGPTVSAAIDEIASLRGCVTMPVADVLLVGRRRWVEATAATLLSIDAEDRPTEKVSVTWDPLTTPQQAVQLAAGRSDVEVSPPLPHDLWPAAHWQAIDRRIAMALVLAQFDRRPDATDNLEKIECRPAESSGRFTRRYRSDSAITEVRRALVQVDPKAAVRVSDGWLEATATIAAHREASSALLRAAAAGVADARGVEEQIFSLKPTRAFVSTLLNSFAEAAGRKCVIETSAKQACEQLMTIEAQDQTLRQLIEQVATRAGVQVDWQPGQIIVRAGGP